MSLPLQRRTRAAVRVVFTAADQGYVSVLDPSPEREDRWGIVGLGLSSTLRLTGAHVQGPGACRDPAARCPSPTLGPLPDPASDALYFAGAGGHALRYVTTEVTEVTPQFVDVHSDDTRLTVRGRGFAPGARCYVGGRPVATAYVGRDTLHCLSRARDPGADFSSASYCGVPVEVGLPSGVRTASDRRIFHVSPPQLTGAFPQRLFLDHLPPVAVHGRGFSPAQALQFLVETPSGVAQVPGCVRREGTSEAAPEVVR